MGTRNRERRAAKSKQRRRESAQRRRAAEWSAFADAGDRARLRQVIVAALREAASAVAAGDDDAVGACARRLVAEFGDLGRELDGAAGDALQEGVAAAWRAGWLPADLHELARRKLVAPLVELLVTAVRDELDRYAPATVHPQWRAMVHALPEVAPCPPGTARLRQWAERHGGGRTAALAAVVHVLTLVAALPVLEPLLPRPGEARHTATEAAGEVDEKALARVRALLAKAESTEFPEEAEALSAKAQELMTRYSLHRALLEHERGEQPAAVGRRLWLEAPYAGAKALLVQAVAGANRSKAVWSEGLGFVTVVGAEADLATVEVLTTSLLVQANQAMLAAGRHVTRGGTSRTRSFRQSFLLAYASRIGERLRSADASSSAALTRDERLLPVLAARDRAVDELTDRLFPRVVSRPVTVSNAAGWGAGRAAADLARFDGPGELVG